MLKNIKSVGVLVAIGTVIALLLALTNQITAPIIEERKNAAANEALLVVMPDGTGFEKLEDISDLPTSIMEAYKETSGLGYVFKINATGYKPDMILMCGVSTDGIITGATCISSNETFGAEKDYGQNFIGKDADSVKAVDTVGGASAPLTKTGYKQAMQDALNAAAVLGGEDVEIRTPEQILQDNLAAALPAGEGKFTKLFLTETGENVSAVYAADNGAGHVVIIGEEFVAVDAEGNSDNAVAAAVVAANKADSTDITASFTETLTTLIANTTDRKALATYKGLQSNVLTVKKTASGNYIIDIQGAGYGINGGDAYHPASGKPIVIRVSMSPAGKIIDCLTVSQEETDDLGSVCGDEDFSSRFDGKTESEIADVDGIAGATLTTDGYKKAVERCFAAVTILEGGAK